MEKFGFSLQSSYTLPMPQVINLLAEVGFCAVSPVWQQDGNLEEIGATMDLTNYVTQDILKYIREDDKIHLTDAGIEVCAKQVVKAIKGE